MTNENNKEEEKDVVKYDGRWWLLESVSEKGMATLYRNGQPALVPESDIEYDKKRTKE